MDTVEGAIAHMFDPRPIVRRDQSVRIAPSIDGTGVVQGNIYVVETFDGRLKERIELIGFERF